MNEESFREKWLTTDLLSSRLTPGETLPETIRWIDCDEALRTAGGILLPGRVALEPEWIATLCRWRIAGLRPLVARAAIVGPESSPGDAVRAALELDVLSGGALDAFRLESPSENPIVDPIPPHKAPEHPIPVPDSSTGARILGALMGLAAGDSLGAPVENWPSEKIRLVHGPFRDFVSGRGWGPGHPTRETVFALLWFRELVNGRTVHAPADRDRLASALARWVTGRPRDFGHLTRGILRAYLADPPVPAAREAWVRARRRPEFNAALSRAAAIGAALPSDQDLRWASVIAASAMTHPAPVCIGSAVAVAEGVAAIVRGEDPLAAARACAWEERTAGALEEVAAGWAPGAEEWNGHERAHPLRTLKAAFWAIRRRGGLEEILLELVHLGGDADTHGAVAGAFLGARDGVQAIPQRWLERLRMRTLIESLVGRFGQNRFDTGSP